MAVDLGTANTLVYVRGRGIVLDEPSVVARGSRDNRLLAVGVEAKRMLGRTPSHVHTVRPLRDGVIADLELCEKMLARFIRRVDGSRRLAKPRMVICVPSGITELERRAVQEVAEAAGARKPAYIIEEPMAAAIGAGLPGHEPTGNMIVDIGGGTTEVAVISMGGIVTSQSVRIGGDKIDQATIQFVKKEYSLAVGEGTAEGSRSPSVPPGASKRSCTRRSATGTGYRPAQDHRHQHRGDPRSHCGTGVGHRRRRHRHARQDTPRAGRRHHRAGHCPHRRGRSPARARRPAGCRDRHDRADRRKPSAIGGHRRRPVTRAVQRPQRRRDLVGLSR